MRDLCCPDHQDEQLTALTFTFVFPSKEFWCGYCGRTFAFFDDYDDEAYIPELEGMARWYKRHYRRYLRAVGLVWGGARLPFHGRTISFSDLSPHTKGGLQLTIDAWKPGLKCPSRNPHE